MKLKEVLENIDYISFTGDQDAPVEGISCNSNTIENNYIFVAIDGEQFDGHSFLPSAREGGATSVISEQSPSLYSHFGFNWIQVVDVRKSMAIAANIVYGKPDTKIPFIAITGTNGKTTTAHIIEQVLSRCGRSPALTGTIVHRFRNKESPATITTPESTDLLCFARKALDKGATHFIMEASSHSLSMKRVYGIQFEMALFTNLTRDHLDFYKSMDAYFDAKRMLFDGRNGSLPRISIINIDDKWGRKLYDKIEGEKYSVGRNPYANFQIINHNFSSNGMYFTIKRNSEYFHITSLLTGKGNLYNVAQAYAALTFLGIEKKEIINAISTVTPAPGRMEEIKTGQNFKVFVDFAHTEDALANVCDILKKLTSGHLIVVFGCGGDRDKGKRPRMGKVVAQNADVVIVTSDNPRSEDPEKIIDEIVPGIKSEGKSYERIADRKEAILYAISIAKLGDTVLLAGKGHEKYQIIKGQKIPFSDKEIAYEALRSLTEGVK